MRFLLVAVLCLGLAAACFADKVTLKDGRVYEGVVLEETEDTVKIKTARTTLTLKREQVASIEKQEGGPLQEREKRLSALDPSKAAGYLDLAKWLTGKGKEAYDLQTLRRLCAAASKLDASQAYEAQMLLGQMLEQASIRREAATAYARALLAKPGNPDARVRMEDLHQGLVQDAKAEMKDLAAALDLVVQGDYAKALPKLQKSETLAMAEEAPSQIGMSIEALTRDVARRVKCTTCDGVGESRCPACDGDGLIMCGACGGTGNKKGFTAGKEKEGISSSVCRTCYGCGSVLCVKCKAERDIQIRFWWTGTYKEYVTVHAKAGREAEALKTEIELTNYTHKSSKWIVLAISGQPPTVGGKTPCGTCQGVKYDPPLSQPPVDRIRVYMTDINDRANGQKPYEVLPKASEVYDRAVLADECLRYVNGNWVK